MKRTHRTSCPTLCATSLSLGSCSTDKLLALFETMELLQFIDAVVTPNSSDAVERRTGRIDFYLFRLAPNATFRRVPVSFKTLLFRT